MTQLNKKNRLRLQELLEKLTLLKSYEVNKEQIRSDNTIRYAVEMLYMRAGDLMKRLRHHCGGLFTTNPIFENLTGFRDVLGHKLESQIDIEVVVSSFGSIDKLRSAIQEVLETVYSDDEILNNFAIFGKRGTQTERQKYADALLDKLKSQTDDETLNFPDSEEFKHISEATESIINHKDLRELSRENDEISKEITHNIIKWAKQISSQLNRNNPFEDEENLLEEFTNKDWNYFKTGFPSLKRKLDELYDKSELNLSFYDKKRKELARAIKKEKSKEKQQKIAEEFQALKETFLKDWQKQLIEKRLQHELKLIDDARKKLVDELYQRIEDYKKLRELLKPFTNDVGRLWDMSKGVWQKTGFDIVRKYAELLKQDKSLLELAELLGRYRQSEKEYEEELFEEIEIKQDWKIEHAHKSEVIGVWESDDLSALLPSETALLANPATEPLFYKKYAEKKLMTFDYQNRSKSTIEEKKEGTRQKAKEEDKGPIIICVDTSGSMQGVPEQVAKVLCFAILKVAMRDNRKCYLISFSTTIQALDLTNLTHSLDKLIEFLSHSFRGGTDATPAIKEAVKMLNTNDYQKSDVLLVSDFVMPTFDDELEEEVQEAKENKTRFHSLTIGSSGNENTINSFDNNWLYNPAHKDGVIELVRNIKKIQKRN